MNFLKRNPYLPIEVFTLALLLGVAVVMESFAVSLYWQFYAVMAFLIAAALSPLLLCGYRKTFTQHFAICNLFVFLLFYFVPITPSKPFLQFQNAIQPGMNVSEVEKLFTQFFPKNGRFRQPVKNTSYGAVSDQFIQYILDPDDGRYNAETLTISFENQKVVGTLHYWD